MKNDINSLSWGQNKKKFLPKNSLEDVKNRPLNWTYLFFTQFLSHTQHVRLGQYLIRVKLVWIKGFPSKLVD